MRVGAVAKSLCSVSGPDIVCSQSRTYPVASAPAVTGSVFTFYAEIQIIFGQCTYAEQKKKEAETQKMGRLVSKMFKNCSHFYL